MTLWEWMCKHNMTATIRPGRVGTSNDPQEHARYVPIFIRNGIFTERAETVEELQFLSDYFITSGGDFGIRLFPRTKPLLTEKDQVP